MTNPQPVPRNQESEALYWLDVAKRVLAGTIRPEEARHILNLGSLYLETVEARADQAPLSPAQQ